MRAVREVNPSARLVQTEDLGKTYSTPRLQYQAEFENERRWLSYDLLAGRVARGHAMWDYLLWVGVAEREILWFAENACPPDVIGINHYVTSERFLDERLARYPDSTHGGNGRDLYADVEAVRVCAEGAAGPRAILREAWERYGLPVAVTEAHLGCTREEQMRWLKEVWDAARDLSAEEGADVRAVTVWSAFGACDWHNLLTRAEGRYEPGVFDVRAPTPRPTALAPMVRSLAARGTYEHPALAAPGWWRRLERLSYPPVARPNRGARVESSAGGLGVRGRAIRPVIITGANGTLGGALARACKLRGLAYELLTRAEMDIADASSVAAALDAYEPWAVVNAAGYVRVDDAEREPERCIRENASGPAVLARECARRDGLPLVTFSSDLVFDGAKREPYVESDEPSPLNVYGRSKLAAESEVLAAHPSALVIRASAFFGPWDEYNFVTVALRALARGERFAASSDETVSPTYVPDLAHAALDLLLDGERGIWHLSNAGQTTWADLARRAAELLGQDPRMIDAVPSHKFTRPLYTALASERASIMPTLDDALTRYARDCRHLTRPQATHAQTPRARAAYAQGGD